MMITRRTVTLLAVFGALLAINLVDREGSLSAMSAAVEEGEAMASFEPEDVTRIELSTSAQKITLKQQPGAEGGAAQWQVVAPFNAKADQARIQSFLALFQKGLPLDVQVDTENFDKYGLDATNGVVVEIFTGEPDTPLISFTVGYDGPGGSSFIRMSDDDAVYRARVGSRAVYEQPAVTWRNQVLLDYDYTDATVVAVYQGGEQTLRFVRGDEPGLDNIAGVGAWEAEPPAPWEVDQRSVEMMVRQFGLLRAGALLPESAASGLNPPHAIVRVTLADGTQRALLLGDRRGEKGVIVQVEGEPEIYQTALVAVQPALRPAEAFRELTLFAIERTQIDTMTLEEGTARVTLQQNDDGTGTWTALEPPNMDVDIRKLYQGINNFAELRAQGSSAITLAEAGLLKPDARITARLYDGSTHTLEIGKDFELQDGNTSYLVRRDNGTQVYVLPEDVVLKMKAAFNRL